MNSSDYVEPPDWQLDPAGEPVPEDPYADLPHPADLTGQEGRRLTVVDEQDPEALERLRRAAFERDVQRHLWDLEARETAARRRRTAHVEEPPPPVLLADLLAEPDEEVAYRIDGLMPSRGRVVLAAQRKAGKSTMVGNLVRALADGEEFLGEFTTRPAAGVYLLDFELSRGTLRRWFADHAVGEAGRVMVEPLRGRTATFDLLDPQRLQWWAARIKRFGTSVLILDCLRPVLDALALDESREAGRFLVALDELLDRAEVEEFVLVHHAGHSGERSRGDSRLRDWPDAEWRLVRETPDTPGEEPPPDARRFFSAEGRDVAVAETALEYDPRTRRLTLGDGNRKQDKQLRAATSALGKVIEALREADGPLSKRGVQELVGGRATDVRAAVDLGVQRGLITRSAGPKGAQLHSLPEVANAA